MKNILPTLEHWRTALAVLSLLSQWVSITISLIVLAHVYLH